MNVRPPAQRIARRAARPAVRSMPAGRPRPARRSNAVSRPLRTIFAMPALIAAVTLVGLVAALLGNGLLDLMSWAALLVPVTVIGWALICRRC